MLCTCPSFPCEQGILFLMPFWPKVLVPLSLLFVENVIELINAVEFSSFLVLLLSFFGGGRGGGSLYVIYNR